MGKDTQTTGLSSPELAADRRADRTTMIITTGMLALSFVLQSSTRGADATRESVYLFAHEIWLQEATSHLALFGLMFLMPFALNRAPLSIQTWRWTVPTHLGFAVAFTVLHVLAMMVMRELAYPLIVGGAYTYKWLTVGAFVYELQKDIFVYGLYLFAFSALRLVEERRLEAAAASNAARRQHRVTLKSGGRTFMIPADEIFWAKAASNYVEVHTAKTSYFARQTLSGLEKALNEAGSDHVRVHRSYLVNRSEVRQTEPTGEGDVTITLSNGATVPGSRRYRDRLDPTAPRH